MITHEPTDCGGSVTVNSPEGNATVHYTLSNKNNPLSLSAHCSTGSNTRVASAIVENLAERFAPSVLLVGSTKTDVRYTPKIGKMFRCWSSDRESVYAEQFSSRNLFSRVCSFSEAMSKTDIIRARGEELDFYSYHAVMSEVRSKKKPFEFLSIKEECDYTLRGTSARCVGEMIRAAQDNLSSLTVLREPFAEALDRIEKKQEAERGYDTRYAYIREFCACILLPAVVKLGHNHPFTQSVFSRFSSASGDYISACEGLVCEYLDNDDTT
jgi:hypothetical protein